MTETTFPLGKLQTVLDHLATADPLGTLVPCGISRILLGHSQLEHVAEQVSALLGEGVGDRPRVVLLVDATPIRRGDQDVKAEVASLLATRFDVCTHVLSDDHPVLHADEHVLEMAAQAAQGADAVVTIGGGTITDVGKTASRAAGGIPLVTVQTAASVDGFTDNVSVVLRSGVKRTVDSRWPDVVIADVEVISQAPPVMNRAGFGEITSMFTAPADWRLADALGLDATFHPVPVQLLDAVGADIGSWSPGVAVADVDAVERLTWALAVRGIATGVSGTTACLSGVEHLVSHMLDLHNGEHGLPMGLHGAQVGVASVVAAAAWELLFERLAAGVPAMSVPDAERARAEVTQAFAHLGAGGIAQECWRDYSHKLAAWTERAARVDGVLSSWGDLEPELRRLVRPAAEIATHLRAAGAPARFSDLDPAVSPELARWAVTNCALMRNRSTVVDLLSFLGWWTAEDVEEVLRRADSVVPPLPADAVTRPRR
jgi:glycerol-1-phosphate dehydrogenase [NAD(P)+]